MGSAIRGKKVMSRLTVFADKDGGPDSPTTAILHTSHWEFLHWCFYDNLIWS